jgi:hypothetical protein
MVSMPCSSPPPRLPIPTEWGFTVTIDNPPDCPGCGNPLLRVDHYGIQHTIYDSGNYRDQNGEEGLASEVSLVCGWCHEPLSTEAKQFFYPRWSAVIQATEALQVQFKAQGYG